MNACTHNIIQHVNTSTIKDEFIVYVLSLVQYRRIDISFPLETDRGYYDIAIAMNDTK